jgi:hypothetical protein
MPLFTQRKPAQTVSRSIAAALSSSAEPSPLEALQVDNLAAQTAFRGAEAQHQGALTQKVIAEVQAAEQAARDRNDPQKRLEHIATVAGATVPDVDRTQLYIRSGGERPLGITDQIERAIRAAAGALTSTDLATGKTNAEQMSHAQGSILSNIVRNASVGLPADQQNANVGPFRATAREPFSGGVNAQGVMANQETGAATVAVPPLLEAVVRAQQALGSSREASATAAEARAAASEARAAARGTGGGGGGSASGDIPPKHLGKPKSGYQWVRNESGEWVQRNAIENDPNNAPPGKALPTGAAKPLFENQQNLRKAQQALALIGGSDIKNSEGEVVASGDKDATGWKALLSTTEIGDKALQKLDPKGVATRAAIANIGSMVIHERSGAAVTAAEYPRLRPFIPKVTDDQATAEKKLKAFVNEYQNIVAEMADFYRESGYKVPDETLRGSGVTPSASPPAADRRQEPRAAGSKRIVVDY